MRLHQLAMTAFGPFPDTESVDFDELNDAGLFLLTGPTGAGKTSILDAVCFALYGSVPGVRGVKTLRSHHAAPDTAPEVTLDFEVAGRRFTVRRSPEWERAKKRGEGTVREKAQATLVETTTGEEHFLSSRAQEVGHFVSELLGMNASQFAQVAMLPQGEFQKFLRASSDDRHAVLQALFRTDRFTRIEDWVHDHSRRLAGRAGDGQAVVPRVLDTAADRAAADLPESLTGSALPKAAADGLATDWLDSLLAQARTRAATTVEHHEHAARAAVTAREAVQTARRRADARTRGTQATAVLDQLAASEAEAARTRALLSRHTAAAPVLPLLAMLDQATTRHAQAQSGLTGLTGLTELTGLADAAVDTDAQGFLEPAIERRRDALRDRITRLEQLLPRERERRGLQQALTREQHQLQQSRRVLTELAARRTELPGELDRLGSAREAEAGRAVRQEAIELALLTARGRLEAARLVPALAGEITTLKDLERDRRDETLGARERVQDLLERRLEGYAAELAGRLEEGAPCQVCGSLAHPEPARPGVDAVTEAEQEQAGAAYDLATERYAEASNAVADAERQLATVGQAAGGCDVAGAADQVTSLEEALHDAKQAGVQVRTLDGRIAALTREQQDLVSRTAQLHTETALLERSTAEAAQAIAALDDEISHALHEHAAPDGAPVTVAAALDRTRARHDEARHALEVVRRVAAAAERLDEVTAQADRTAAEHGFTGLDVVRAAALTGDERDGAEHWLGQRGEGGSRARAVLEEPEVAAELRPDAAPLPDPAALTLHLGAAEETLTDTSRERHTAEATLVALQGHHARLLQALEDWAPLRDDFVRADGIARLVRGQGGNQLQMRLSAYVLATRLDQVVDAANERLGHMRDQRYLLQRTGRAARKGSQAGLGLEVVDQWTGETRDPATLSGGETFVVSLSLALGLADVVTHEAGGTEIETLFVDEGFGTLDADTLDDVMDRLDGLRAGGRTVGVVSHVSEMRNRIPTQVHVEKGRAGSAISTRTLTA